MSNATGLQGSETILSSSSDYNAIAFIVNSLIGQIGTLTWVQVVAVTNDGDVDSTGFVNILPLINQLDGLGNPIPHEVIENCPYWRLQSGNNACIMDPQVGDTGLAFFCDKDHSKLIANFNANPEANAQQVNPDSYRRFSFSDAIYFGSLLTSTPTQYIQFNSDGITIVSPELIKLQAPDVQISCTTMEVDASDSITITTGTYTVNASSAVNITTPTTTIDSSSAVNITTPTATITGAAIVTGQLQGGTIVTSAGINLDAHVHTNVQSGGSNTGPATG